jgi:filamentous hemagglutinin
MTQQIINVGAAPNDGLGDPIREAYIKCNDNFGELYSRVQVDPPTTLIGTTGDRAGMYAYDSNYFYYCYANYNGSSQIWGQIAELGNVVVNQIVSGTSNVVITDINGNIAVSVNGVSNVAVFTPTGMTASGNVTALNLNATNINGTVQTSNQPAITQLGTLIDLNVAGNTVTANLNASSTISSSGTITATGDITGGNINSSNSITATGNVNAVNVNASGNVVSQGGISAVGDITTTGTFIGTFAGNITGNFVVPGANTQVIFNTNGNADAVAGMTYNKDSNVFAVLGNVSAGNILASAAVTAVANITGGNLITAGLASATGNVTGGNLITAGQVTAGTTVTATGNITGGNVSTAGQVTAGGALTATGNITGGNLITLGVVTASGNITGGNVVGGGITAVSNITGGNISITSLGSFGNITAVNNITGANLNSTNLSATTLAVTGNISAGNIIANTAISTSGTITAQGNINGNGITAQGNITSVGNVSAGAFIAGGVIQAVSTITGGAFSTTGAVTASGNITATGNVSGGNLITTGQVVSSGNVSGGNLLVTGNIVDTGELTVITGSNGNITLSPNGTGVIVASKDIRNGQANAVGNIGSSTGYFNTVFASATSALYADLAEKYLSDAEYEPGTVLCFGGAHEVTQCDSADCVTVAGVVSTNPSYIMNSGLEGQHVVDLALMGRVPCRVVGPVTRGAMMVSAGNGQARASSAPAMGTVIGKALANFDGDQGMIEIVVGRL